MKLGMLAPGDVSLLTEILQLRSNDRDPIHYTNRIATLIEALPSRLKAEGFLKRIIKPPDASDSRMLDPLDQRGPLCPLHHKLNASLVQKVFVLLALEVGHHLNHVARKRDLLSDVQKDLILRLRALHAIWYRPDDYERFFQLQLRDTKWTYQGNKCAACSLSRIAGDAAAILDLICAISSRSSSNEKRKKPRLHEWLMAWLAHHRNQCDDDDRKNFQMQIFQNEVQALELKARRKEFSKARKQAKVPMQPIPEEVPLVAQNVHMYEHIDDDDLESINLHAALLSSPHLPDMSRFQQQDGYATRYADRNSPRPSYVSCKSSTSQMCNSSASIHSPVSPLTPRAEQEYVPPRANWKPVEEEPTPRIQTNRGPRYRSSEDAAESYANILPKSNPFASRAAVNNTPAPGAKGKSTAAARQPSSSSRATIEPESVWTDCDPQASRRSSLSSLMEKYANYGGLPVPPNVHGSHSCGRQSSEDEGTVSPPPPPRTTEIPLRRSASAATTPGPKHKAPKHLAPDDLVKRAHSTKSETRHKDSTKSDHRPSPIKVDRPVPSAGKLPVENILKRAASSSDRTKDASHHRQSHRNGNNAENKQGVPRRGASLESDSLAPSPLFGYRGRRDHQGDQMEQRPRRKSQERERAKPLSEAPGTNMTRWSMGWKDEVVNRPENKFYKERLEREQEEARRAENERKQRKR